MTIVDGKHLIRFQSENSVFKFLSCSVDGAYVFLSFGFECLKHGASL